MKLLMQASLSMEIIKTDAGDYKFVIHGSGDDVLDWGHEKSLEKAKDSLGHALKKLVTAEEDWVRL